MSSREELIARIQAYDGGPPSRELVETVIDLNIAVEPDPSLDVAEYDKMIDKWRPILEAGDVIVRKYGEALPDKSFDALTEEYYSFTNSDKYRQSSTTLSVCAEVLKSCWEGIGMWRD